VLVAAGFHAAWNRFLHGTSDRVAAMAVSGIAGGALLLPALIVAPPRGVLLLIVLSALAETAYALCLSAAYRRGALAVTYPVGRGVAPLLVTLGGWAVLAQRPTPLTLAGALALVAGLSLVAMAGRRAAQGAAVAFALLTGCCIASYSLIDARAVQHVSPAGYLSVVLLLQGFLLTGCLRGDRKRLRAAAGTGVLIAVGSVAAYLLVLFAFQLTAAGRVSTLREVSVLIGLLLAREQAGPRVWAGALLVVVGMVLAVT
jgi:drug/metabolite transporter (DMT)-like permease